MQLWIVIGVGEMLLMLVQRQREKGVENGEREGEGVHKEKFCVVRIVFCRVVNAAFCSH